MPDTILKQDPNSLDLTKVAALQQKRTLAFVNHFVVTTVQFINNFSKQCEMKLMQFETKLEKINATMVLLEARLSSIPEINEEDKSKEVKAAVDEKPNKSETVQDNDITEVGPTSDSSNETRPEYERFVKMIQVGVPLDAVKLKVALEGLDPKELDKILGK